MGEMVRGGDTIVFLAFAGLMGLTIAHPSSRAELWAKSWKDWLLDGLGLWVQGILIPLLQVTVIYQLVHVLLPQQQGCLHMSAIVTFLLSFVVVDYLYYWNHRWLHSRLWLIHQVHHTLTVMDVLSTSRNTLWSSFFIVYLWVHTLFLYLLHDPTAYLIGVSLTSALDLWRHSQFRLSGSFYRWLSPWLIMPQHHALHHAREVGDRCHGVNFGANFTLWDRLHGTYRASKISEGALSPSRLELGYETNLTLFQKLLYPFGNLKNRN